MKKEPEKTEITKLQETLKTGWFRPDPKFTLNTHIHVDQRVTLTPEYAELINKEIQMIELNYTLGIKPTTLQLLAFEVLKSSM